MILVCFRNNTGTYYGPKHPEQYNNTNNQRKEVNA